MRKRDQYKIYEKYGFWINLTALLFFYAMTLSWIPFSRNKILGVLFAIVFGYEAITSFLTGRMRTRWCMITAKRDPKLFWIQVILMGMLSIFGIIYSLLAK
jgi:predicted membrane channel-forming protein YqfA (hemolysin III family)